MASDPPNVSVSEGYFEIFKSMYCVMETSDLNPVDCKEGAIALKRKARDAEISVGIESKQSRGHYR